MELSARAFWLRSPGHGEIRDVAVPAPAEGEVLVRTLFSGVSRGTETLVFRGVFRKVSMLRCVHRSRTGISPHR